MEARFGGGVASFAVRSELEVHFFEGYKADENDRV
jgi:hypothetical protein